MAQALQETHPWKERSETVAYGSLLLLAWMAPFERRAAVAALAGMQITNVEAVLGVSILCGLVWAGFNGFRATLRTPLTMPALLLLAAMMVSTLAADDHRGEAIRFLGRFAGGFCVFLLAAGLLSTRRRFLGLAAAVASVASIVAVLGVVEHFESGLAINWLASFKPGPFYAGGMVRASSTLQYPTIASMYLEIAFGLGLGLLAHCLTANRRRLGVLAFLSLLVIAVSIMATLTRGGLIAMAVQLALALPLYYGVKGFDGGFRVLLALAVCVGAIFLAFVTLSPGYLLRVQTLNPKGWYVAGFEVPDRLEFSPRETREVRITVSNLGKMPWNPDVAAPFRVSYHWLDPVKDSVVVFEGLRSPLPEPLPPGSSLTMKARVQAPRWPGEYRLAWDIVQENRFWFGSGTGIRAYSRVLVHGPEAGGPAVEGPPLPKSQSLYQLERPVLWRAVLLILADRPLVGVGPGNFRLLHGEYLGLETWNRSLHANNTFLEFFANTGVPGGLLYLWLWLRLGALLLRSWRRKSASILAWLLAAVASVGAIFVHGMVDDFLSFTPTYIMIWLAFGLAAAPLPARAED